MKTVGIIQPNYMPWRGFFDFIHEVDVFVFLDNVQFTPRDWRSRNRIRQRGGDSKWLTVPVIGGRNQLISEVRIDNTQRWAKKHLQSLRQNYGKSPCFARYLPTLEACFEAGRFQHLCDLNKTLTQMICEWLGLTTPMIDASTLKLETADKEQRLVDIVQAVEGDRYLSGPAARDYLQPELWSRVGIELSYKDYSGYPEYEQIAEPFDGAVSVLDLLFMVGDEAPEYIWGSHRER